MSLLYAYVTLYNVISEALGHGGHLPAGLAEKYTYTYIYIYIYTHTHIIYI